jgi:1-acyl-sn-glycerol-3-phosphate acyltransferase
MLLTREIKELPSIPSTYQWKTSEDDPFETTNPSPLWKSLPVFFMMLPLTAFFMLTLFFVSILFFFLYGLLSGRIKDLLGKLIAANIVLCARFKLNVLDYSNGAHSQLFVSNHVCLLEAMMIVLTIGHVRFIAAEFVRKIPIFGILIRVGDPLYVERSKGRSNTVERMADSLKNTSYRHLLFPEGSYENGKYLLKFKTGAFVLGEPVTPILFHYPQYTPFWNRQESSFFVQIYRFISRIYTPVTLAILPIYHPSEQEKSNPSLYAENVRKLMSFYLQQDLSIFDNRASPNYKKDRLKNLKST